ncbi:hypothetical protein V6N13_061111 [Hibiscus sabdariffa]
MSTRAGATSVHTIPNPLNFLRIFSFMGNHTSLHFLNVGRLVSGFSSGLCESRVRHTLCRRNRRLERPSPGLRHRVAAAIRHWNEAHRRGKNGGCTVSTLSFSFLQVLARWVALAGRYKAPGKVYGLGLGVVFGKVWFKVVRWYWYEGDGSGIPMFVWTWKECKSGYGYSLGLEVEGQLGHGDRIRGTAKEKDWMDKESFREWEGNAKNGSEGGWVDLWNSWLNRDGISDKADGVNGWPESFSWVVMEVLHLG